MLPPIWYEQSFLYKYSVNSRHVLIGWYPFSFPYLFRRIQGFPQTKRIFKYISLRFLSKSLTLSFFNQSRLNNISAIMQNSVWGKCYKSVAKNVIWTSRFCNFLLWSPWALHPTYIFIFKPNKWIFTTCNITTTTTTAAASPTLLAIKAFRTFHGCPNVAINILSRHYYIKEICSDELYWVTTY